MNPLYRTSLVDPVSYSWMWRKFNRWGGPIVLKGGEEATERDNVNAWRLSILNTSRVLKYCDLSYDEKKGKGGGKEVDPIHGWAEGEKQEWGGIQRTSSTKIIGNLVRQIIPFSSLRVAWTSPLLVDFSPHPWTTGSMSKCINSMDGDYPRMTGLTSMRRDPLMGIIHKSLANNAIENALSLCAQFVRIFYPLEFGDNCLSKSFGCAVFPVMSNSLL